MKTPSTRPSASSALNTKSRNRSSISPNDIVVHPEDNWKPLVDVGGDNKRNLVAQACDEHGDVDAVLASSDVVIDRTYHTRQNQQGAMETFRAYAYKDAFGRLTIVSSTQVPFHVRRVVANALEIPKSKIRVIKPRIGGGFTLLISPG